MEDILKSGRRVGNTTRLVDMFVQQFFRDGKVMVYDHHPDRRASRRTFGLVVQRLRMEHGLSEEAVNIDPSRFTITCKNGNNVKAYSHE